MTNLVNITFSADSEFNDLLSNTKDKYGLNSISALIKKAVEEYVFQMELRCIREQMDLAESDPEHIALMYEDLETGDPL